MIFSNINTASITIFILLFVISLIVFYFELKEYKKTKNKQRFTGVIFLLISFIILLFPIFGIKTLKNINSKSEGTNIVFVLDVSKSMNALDFSEGREVFSRLIAAKSFIGDFISQNQGNKYSLVVFAGDTQRVLPFTQDTDLFVTMLTSVDENNVSKQGTNLKDALKDGFKNFTSDNDFGSIVLISDGSDEDSINLDELKDLKNENVKLLVVGVGTTLGAHIPIGQDPFGQIVYKTYNGEKVVTKLNENSLKDIANYFSGNYYNLDRLSKTDDLASLLKGVSKKTLTTNKENYVDLTRNFVIVSFLFFIIYLISLFRYGKNK
ncbi:VWA domain-containing protein [Candidatus Gracilibacteria bacterium]|nr:VWA domain-containing protein [Candidatus Gracilibacteria bacterium]